MYLLFQWRSLPKGNPTDSHEDYKLEFLRVGEPNAVHSLCCLVKQHRPQIAFLKETKLHQSQPFFQKTNRLFDNCYAIDVVGRSGGLILLWGDEIDLIVESSSMYHISACICNSSVN